MARYQCWQCPGHPWTVLRVPAGLTEQRREQIAMAALHAHTNERHPWRAA